MHLGFVYGHSFFHPGGPDCFLIFKYKIKDVAVFIILSSLVYLCKFSQKPLKYIHTYVRLTMKLDFLSTFGGVKEVCSQGLD